jgi:hypothetical protein
MLGRRTELLLSLRVTYSIGSTNLETRMTSILEIAEPN